MSSDKPAVVVKDLYKSFRLPHEQSSGIKQLLVNFLKREKGYEIQRVLNDVSFEIKKGEFFGIVGRNGSGKSTLLKLLAGIYVPDKGAVQVNGSLTPFIELGVGFNPELTGRENVYLNGALLGFSRQQMEQMYDDIVEFAELEKFMDQRLKNYSSGMQVRLAFSIAIRAESDILLIDEVLAVGDSAFQQKCFDYFQKLKENKSTIILVTHDMESVKRFCTRALIISDGHMEAIGRPSEIADLYTRENIESAPEEEEVSSSIKATIKNKDTYEDDRVLKVHFKYNVPKVPYYLGVSLIYGGIAVAELNSKSITIPPQNDATDLTVNIDQLNPGYYEMGVAIFNQKTGALLDFDNKATKFFIPGADMTRGGALKLAGEWKSNE